MKKYTPKLNKRSVVVNSQHPGEQKNYILYFHSGLEEFEVYLELDKVLILRKTEKSEFRGFFFILEKD